MVTDNAHSGEKVIRVIAEHWIKYIVPSFLYFLLTSISVLVFWLAGYTAHHSLWLSSSSFLVALVLFFGTHHWFFTRLLGEAMTHIVVTNHRIIWIHEVLFVREQMAEYAFDKMKTVEARKQGFLQNILRYGSLRFESGVDIHLVPHPNSVTKDIEQAMGMM